MVARARSRRCTPAPRVTSAGTSCSTERLVGTPVVDRSLAGKDFGYDLGSGAWSPQRLAAWDVDPALLPAIVDWGTAVGEVARDVADGLGLPAGVAVGVGALDTSCAALGTGACRPGVVGLAVGSWESFVLPVAAPLPVREVAEAMVSLGPHPGGGRPRRLVAQPERHGRRGAHPRTAPAVARRARRRADRCGPDPSPVIAVPHLSGATSPWRGGDRSEGSLVGMSLATTRVDVARAFLEGIALDLALTMERLRAAGAAVERVRVTGGGAQSPFWMQLKADLTGLPFEVVAEPEAGALGAAILAGVADGTYVSSSRRSMRSASPCAATSRMPPAPRATPAGARSTPVSSRRCCRGSPRASAETAARTGMRFGLPTVYDIS